MQKFRFRSSAFCVLVVIGALACRSEKAAQKNAVEAPRVDTTATLAPRPNLQLRNSGNMAALAPLIVYKTKKDYSHHVPVQLSEDKKQIVSYPAPSDLLVDGKLKFPEKLQNGYLLDKTGVTLQTAYLKITLEEYTRAGAIPPPADEMLKNILDADPIVEMYACGPKAKYTDPTTEMNRCISDGKLTQFQKLK